jgi:hypothetical protein
VSWTSPTPPRSAPSTPTKFGFGAGGGFTLDTVTLVETSGTAKVTIADEVFTASGAVGPFRYTPIYNDTATSPADALVCWYDYGSSISLATSESFTWDFDGTNGLWQLV